MCKMLKCAVVMTIIAVIVLASSTGCEMPSTTKASTEQTTLTKQTKESATTTKKDRVTLNIYMFGTDGGHYRNVDPVIEEFYRRTKDTLNTTLNITWTPPADHGTKLRLWFASNQDMDLVVPFEKEQQAKGGLFADLGKYFNNPKYPGLQRAFSTEYINDNKIYGKTYLVPITNSFMDMEGVWYRKDLLIKYGIRDIESYDDLYNFLEKVSLNETDYFPFSNYGNYAFFKLFTDPNARQLDGKVFSFMGGGNPKLNFIDVQIADDGKSVKGIAAYGDPASEWADFNKLYGEQYILNQYNQCVRFNKFISKDVLTNTIATGKDSAAGFVTLNGFQGQKAKVKAKFPNSELGFWPLYKNNHDLIPRSQATDGKAWNFLAVPVTSKKIDRTMDFLNWVFESQENNDLFTYGIEGKNWQVVGTNQWKVPDGVDPSQNYLFPGYQMTWNPTLSRMPAGLDDKLKAYYEYQYKPDTFKKHVLAGFTFDQEPVKNEIAKCNSVAATYLPFLLSGFGDVNTNLAEMHKDLKASGVDNIKIELKNQINAFLSQKQ